MCAIFIVIIQNTVHMVHCNPQSAVAVPTPESLGIPRNSLTIVLLPHYRPIGLHNPICIHSTKKPVTTMLTYAWKCTVLHCNHLGNSWKPLVLMTRHFDYCPSASEGQVISTSGFQVFPRWLQCKTVHFQG